jgi:hypothetical protein
LLQQLLFLSNILRESIHLVVQFAYGMLPEPPNLHRGFPIQISGSAPADEQVYEFLMDGV